MSMPYGLSRRRKRGYSHDAEYAEKFRRFDARNGWTGERLRIEQIAHPEHLHFCLERLAAEGGPAPGIDRIVYPALSPNEWGRVLRELSESMLAGNYLPRESLKKPIPKGDTGKVRVLSIGAVADRVAAKAVANAFAPFWEARFWEHSYGFRVGRRTWDMLAMIEAMMLKTRWTVIANDDIKSAFDTVPIDAALSVHADALATVKQPKFSETDKQRTLGLVETVIRGHDRTRDRGIEQGSCYAPLTLNALLDIHHDKRLNEITTKPLGCRYADNVPYLLPCVPDGERTLSEVQERLLTPLGMTLKGEDGVQDLSKGEQTQLLGFTLRWNGKRLILSPNPDSLIDLRQRLGDAHLTLDPPCTANSAITGWADAMAPAFENGDLSDVYSVAVEYGFREISRDRIQQRWENARQRWQTCRIKAQKRLKQG